MVLDLYGHVSMFGDPWGDNMSSWILFTLAGWNGLYYTVPDCLVNMASVWLLYLCKSLTFHLAANDNIWTFSSF